MWHQIKTTPKTSIFARPKEVLYVVPVFAYSQSKKHLFFNHLKTNLKKWKTYQKDNKTQKPKF